jgi:Leucine-rich repeat (LRR) protein
MMFKLFLPALLLALSFASITRAAAKADPIEQQAIALAEEHGGSAKVDEKLDEIARVSVKFDRADDALLRRLCKMPSVGAVEILDATKCTELGFASLKELPDLQNLVISKCALNEKQAAAIGTLRSLNVLFLGESKLTDSAFSGFKKLVNLKVLDVSDAHLGDKSAAVILGMKKLEELNLSGTKFGDAGANELKDLPKLRLIRLNRTNVTRKGIDALEEARGKAITVRY